MPAKRLTEVMADFVARVKLKSAPTAAAIVAFLSGLVAKPPITLKDLAKLALLPAVGDANLDRPVDTLVDAFGAELEARGRKWWDLAIADVVRGGLIVPLAPPEPTVEERLALLERAAARQVSAPTPPPSAPSEPTAPSAT